MSVTEYLWVSNPAKALRAEKELKAKGLPVEEEAVKELYIKYGGYVLTDDEQVEKAEAIEEEKKEEKPKSRFSRK
jgi:hypothetical protein